MSNEPARMAKWAEKTESIAKQINEATEQTARLQDKIGFVLLTPPPKQAEGPEDTGPELRAQLDQLAGSMHLGGSPDNSALNSKLDNIQRQLQELNTMLADLFDKVDV